MSWFPDTSAGLASSESELEVEWTAPDEVVDGTDGRVRVERRGLFWLSAAAVATVLGPAAAQQPAGRQDPAKQDPLGELDFPGLLEQIYPAARRAVGGTNEEAYLMGVAAALSRLSDDCRGEGAGSALREAMRAFRREHANDSPARFPLMAIAMSLKPGGGFAPHDHRDYNGVIMGLEGEVRIRNYEILGDAPVPAADQPFEIRETVDRVVRPGRISTLARQRDNIHDLVAGPEGARVLDVFTFYEKDAGSHYLEVDERPVDPDRRIYKATWKR